ncbi:nicotinamide-nucleotide amidohydrolase family protein [Weissella tructae]|uniref:Competence-damage protein n=2 Tax=Weissella TaxID=46255 RepID=A0ABN4DHK1_9LACO|nr:MULTISPECIES: nicotinamide-nucleotide amidohydrolase family protein [Weissella]AIG65731.1 Putative competence-damage protein [Weissella tructae]AIM63047.1 Putative competence-damage protein [Weissella ceti]AIM64446.1 Putative competence-damage protein [Weissella ceti]ELA06816.1 competence damage-inducible protein A [Weissella ceti NC36]QVV90896.1 nicotinamide-nucleotide amidohydrolase family protein [Weissella tructae]
MTLIETLGDTLITKDLSITAAESLTAGMFLSELGNVPGISAVLPGGFVTYSAETKASMVDVSMDLITSKGVVSHEVAQAMAAGAQNKLNTDVAVSFTGVAGPGPSEGHAAGTVFIGLALNGQVTSREYAFQGDRLEVRTTAVNAAVEWLLDVLENND